MHYPQTRRDTRSFQTVTVLLVLNVPGQYGASGHVQVPFHGAVEALKAIVPSWRSESDALWHVCTCYVKLGAFHGEAFELGHTQVSRGLSRTQ